MRSGRSHSAPRRHREDPDHGAVVWGLQKRGCRVVECSVNLATTTANARDFVTVLTGTSRALATKVIHASGPPKPAGWAFYFTVEALPIADLADLHALLM